MEVILLGTGSSVPTPEKWHSSVVIRYEKELLLFDCGEAAQIRIQQAKLSPMRFHHIFLTHYHGDHFFGLPGLLFSMQMNKRTEPLHIYGPKGLKPMLRNLFAMQGGGVDFPIHLHEIVTRTKKTILETGSFQIDVAPARHSIPTLAYAFCEREKVHLDTAKLNELGVTPGPALKTLQEKGRLKVGKKLIMLNEVSTSVPGKKVVYTGDTAKCASVIRLARGADLLIHEATYSHDLVEKAHKYLHSTAREAAEVARAAGVAQLVLVHHSRRHDDLSALLAEAKEVFPASALGMDLMEFSI